MDREKQARRPDEELTRKGGVIAPEGVPFILAMAAVTGVLYFLWPRNVPVALAALLLTAFVAWFFRNPQRTPPAEPGAVVSPADGRIVFAGECSAGRYYPDAGKRVSVFMNVFDVHVNRAPVAGTVRTVSYNSGEFHVASVDKASLLNEQNGVLIETPAGEKVAYVQIAGLIARRIVCDLSVGDSVRQGQRVGMIRFGSRVDILLPASAVLKVKTGDRVRAGESIVGVIP